MAGESVSLSVEVEGECSMRQKLMRIVMLSSALSALVLATAAPALASTETALVTVSSTNPYAGCSIPGNPGTNFPDAEVEPQVAVNPA